MARWGLRSRTRARIPVSSSTAIPASGAFSLGHDVLADPVVHVGREPCLLAAALLEQPSRGGCLLDLQPFPDSVLAFAVAVQARPAEPVTVRGGRDVDDAQVDSEEPVRRFGLGGLGTVDDRVQQPHPVLVQQIGYPDRRSGAQQGEMPGVSDDPHGAESTSDRPDRHCPVAARVTELPGQTASVERLRRLRAEPDRGVLDLSAPVRPRGPVVACIEVGPQCRVGVHGLADDPDRRLGCQPEPFPQLGIEAFLHVELPEHLVGVHPFRQRGSCRVAGAQGIAQRRRLLGRRWQPHLHDPFHVDHHSVGPCHHGGNPTPTYAGDAVSSTTLTST
ncbi:hypothetical protein C8D87_1011305 [Lentzea atacamensis]|uniref:Uncharacterized protein n=1 Tax=Lentzea atacamensis TaxID=531938 RepID=A0ABX9ELI8_9PSEU|nr:hypothetical protein C8D87_1011305 [Lentzea atacamensis]